MALLDPALGNPTLDQLRSVFLRARYTAEAVAERLRVSEELRVRDADIPLHRRRLTAGDDLDGLIQLFLLGLPVDRRDVGRWLDPAPLDELEHLGLVELHSETARAQVRVTPVNGKWFAHDPSDASGLRPDSVLGWTPAGRTLASLTVRQQVRSALDLGTGAGLQAVRAAEHASQVVAVDINPRALWLTGLTCALNGIRNVECRQGDMFDPVGDDKFDLIVSNPPFVISPASEYMFRDSGRTADGVSHDVVKGASAALQEGGFATVMCNWVISGDDPWWTRPASWVEACGCDALLLYYEALDPVRYAGVWIQRQSAEHFERSLDEWIAYYRDTRVDAIGIGAIVLRRRSADDNWFRMAEIARGPSGSSSAQLLRIFEVAGSLTSAPDDEFLDLALALVNRHRLEQTLRYEEGSYVADAAELILDDGIGLRCRVSPEALHVLLRMDGNRRVRELVAEAAEETDLDGSVLAAAVSRSLREPLEFGFLVLGGGGGASTTSGFGG